MTGDEKVIIDYLKGSIDNLASKFDIFLNKQETINEQVRDNTKDIAELKESKESKFAVRHPIVTQAIQFVIMVVLFCVLAHFAPGVAHLIGSV